MLYLLAHLALSTFQRRMGEQLGVQPGAELMAAVEMAKEVDAEVVLADRDVQVTLKRTWRNLSFFDKVSVFSGLVAGMFTQEEITEEELEKIKEKDQLSEMMDEFAKAFPSIKEPLIDERDSFLISSIEEAPGSKIVAVVGAGHVRGMTEKFGTTIDRESINVIPPKASWTGWLKWLVPLLVLAAFYVGISRNADRSIWDMLTMWIIPNSIVCALFTLLAGGKIASAMVGFFASPITSLNPTIGAGMAVGLTEAWLRKPTVEDAERIQSDVKSFGGVYKNPFTRVLWVAFLSNTGSALGAYAALLWLWLSNIMG
jgi:pheromone shutdown-related protein TraB